MNCFLAFNRTATGLRAVGVQTEGLTRDLATNTVALNAHSNALRRNAGVPRSTALVPFGAPGTRDGRGGRRGGGDGLGAAEILGASAAGGAFGASMLADKKKGERAKKFFASINPTDRELAAFRKNLEFATKGTKNYTKAFEQMKTAAFARRAFEERTGGAGTGGGSKNPFNRCRRILFKEGQANKPHD